MSALTRSKLWLPGRAGSANISSHYHIIPLVLLTAGPIRDKAHNNSGLRETIVGCVIAGAVPPHNKAAGFPPKLQTGELTSATRAGRVMQLKDSS
ncbi:hypothetical protein J6590_006456 [Homalodisca vitripennis]|nr:hypothetical protein J6590_006456 [Homalodisca vitripennis]